MLRNLVSRLRKEARDLFGGIFSVPGDFLGLGMGMPPAESGVTVTEMTAMQVAAVAACIRIISSAVATLPLGVYERLENGGFKLATDHPLYPLFSASPSPDYTAVDFIQAGQVHCLQTGNGYAEIVRNNGGQPVEFLLRSPFRTFLYRDTRSGELVYKTTDTPNGFERIIDAVNMIHVKGLGLDPYTGLSPIKWYAREVIGVALAAQAYGARLFKNDARPGGYLQSDAIVKAEDKVKRVQSWMAGHSGANSHQVAFLDGGTKWQQVGIAPEEAQFLETQKADAIKIGYIYGVPGYMLGGEQESRATIEQKALEFLMWSIKPWLRKWEQAINAKVFPTTGRNAGKYFVKFDTAEYERADFATLLKGLQVGRYAGLVTIDEGRKALGHNPTTPDNFDPTKPGMCLMQPVNMATITEDGLITAAGATGNGSEGDQTGQPEDQGSTGSAADDGRNIFREYWGTFKTAITQVREVNKPTLTDFQLRFRPIYYQIADNEWDGNAPHTDTAAEVERCITALHANWPRWAVRGSAEETFRKAIRAIVRAAKAHAEREQND